MSYNPTDLEGQEERKKGEAEIARIKALTEQSDFRWLMRQRPFRRFMWKLLSDAGVFRSSFSTEVGVMAFQEGRRDIGLQLMALIHELCPEHYQVMVDEQRQQKEMKAQ
jgi:hypothetical protein